MSLLLPLRLLFGSWQVYTRTVTYLFPTARSFPTLQGKSCASPFVVDSLPHLHSGRKIADPVPPQDMMLLSADVS